MCKFLKDNLLFFLSIANGKVGKYIPFQAI